MKILFFSSYHVSPHFETELEIAIRLIGEGHEVFFLQCKRQLKTCFANPKHTFIGCKLCMSRIKEGYKLLNLPESHFLTLPDIQIDYSNMQLAVKNIGELKRLEYKGADIGLAVASSIISYIRDHSPDTNQYRSLIEEGIKTAIYTYEAAMKVLSSLNPDEVYLFNGRFTEVRPFMRVCEAKRITYYTHERGGILKNFLLRKDSTPHSISTAAKEINRLWGNGGPAKESRGASFFIDRRNKVVQGWHSFTKDQKMNKLPENFNPGLDNIVIFNSSMDEYEGITGFNNLIYENDNTAIREVIDAFSNDKSKHFYLRIHPNLQGLKNSQLREISEIDKKYNNLTVIQANEDIDSYALMEVANKVIAFTSTMGIESVYWNKPVILLGRAFYEALNCFYKPQTQENVVDLLNRKELLPFNQQEALKYGYWILNFGEGYKRYFPISVTKGKFNGKSIRPNQLWRLLYIIEKKLKNEKT